MITLAQEGKKVTNTGVFKASLHQPHGMINAIMSYNLIILPQCPLKLSFVTVSTHTNICKLIAFLMNAN